MRLEALEEDIARNLEQHIWHEENHQRRVVLIALETQLLGEPKNVRVGNVDTIEESYRPALVIIFPFLRGSLLRHLPNK